MSAHTPGPWFHSNTSMWGCVTTKPDGHGHVVAEVDSPHTGKGRLDHNRTEETKANARLIAAAPDLLAALKAVAATMATDHVAYFETQRAIAKAEGKP